MEELDLRGARFTAEAWDEVLRWPCPVRLKGLRLNATCLIDPTKQHGGGEIQELPAYRSAFEQKVRNIDWETVFMDPWTDDTCWHGLSCEDQRRQHLFSMWPYIQRRDYDGLEAALRVDRRRHAGEGATAAIDALPFQQYEKDLQPGPRAAIAAATETLKRYQRTSHWTPAGQGIP